MGTAKIAVFDSGLGGLTVYRALRSRLPGASYIYFADNAAFPYGDWREDALVERILSLFERLIERERPDVCVIACNTASTIALQPLRDRFNVPFVGTVPAVKVAAEQTQSRRFSVLATPATVRRDYTRALIRKFAADCDVTLVGASQLAALAERHMRGQEIEASVLRDEIAPAFVGSDGCKTDIIVLGCTHFPLLQVEMAEVAPWPVQYIDPAPAIARQAEVVLQQIGDCFAKSGNGVNGNRLFYTGEWHFDGGLANYLRELGLTETRCADWLVGA